MAIRKIAQIGHPVLRQVAREVTREELATPAMQQFIDDLVETMHDADGAGLAAIQVYEPIRICAIEVRNNPRYPYKPQIPLTILVNPVLTPVGDEQFDNYEGCLSVPNLRGMVKRHVHVRVQAWDRHGNADRRGRARPQGRHVPARGRSPDGNVFVDRVTDPSTFTTWTEFERHHQRRVRREGPASWSRASGRDLYAVTRWLRRGPSARGRSRPPSRSRRSTCAT